MLASGSRVMWVSRMKNEKESNSRAVLMLRAALMLKPVEFGPTVLRPVIIIFGLLSSTLAVSQSDVLPDTQVIQENATIDATGNIDVAAESSASDGQAQSKPADTGQNEQQVVEPEKIEPQKTDQNRAERSKRGVDNQVFIPSEEISEDKPVPFPVDI